MNMKKNLSHILLFLWMSMVCLLGCKTPELSGSEHVKGKALASSKENADLLYLFFNANKEKILGNFETASGLFAQCIKLDKDNHASMYELALLDEQQGKYSEALSLIKNAVAHDPKNSWYMIAYAEILKKNKKFNDAVAVYSQLLKYEPDRVDFYYSLGTTQMHAGKYADAIKTYDKLEEQIGISPEISTQKEKLYIKLNKVEKAILELQKLIDAFPQESSYYGMLAELYQANSMNDKAFDTYNKILKMDPDNPYIHLSLADYYRTINDKEKSFQELKSAFKNKDMEVDTKIQILTSYIQLQQTNEELRSQAYELAQILLEMHPNESEPYARYGDLLLQDKKIAEARDQYRQALQIDKKSYLVWEFLLRTDLALSDYNALLTESEEALSLFPNQAFVYFCNGLAKMEKNQNEEALEIFNAGLNLIINNDLLKIQFYTSIGDLYHKMKKNKESDEAFEEALKLDPKNALVLNNYSYYLSVRSENLEKAEKMSLLSNQLDPENANSQDTYGWILYKEKKHQEAKEWLEKALKNDGEKSATLLEHLGDILFQLGDAENALIYWQKAKSAGEGSEMLNKKISEKKLYE